MKSNHEISISELNKNIIYSAYLFRKIFLIKKINSRKIFLINKVNFRKIFSIKEVNLKTFKHRVANKFLNKSILCDFD